MCDLQSFTKTGFKIILGVAGIL